MTTANDDQQNNLATLREEKGLTKSDVASKLKLTMDVISKLEESKFRDLGAYTYVRGYLLNYADLLQINADKYIALIPQDSKNVQIINTYSKSAKMIKFKRQSKGVGSYAVGTLIVLAVSFSGWYLLKMYSSKSSRTYLDSNTTLELNPENSEIATQEDVVGGALKSDSEENDSFHYSSLIPTNESTVVNTKPEERLTNKQQEAALGFENVQKEVASQEDSSNIIDEVGINKQYIIEVNAQETSWIKIENSDGKKLFADLFQPGKKVFESDFPIHFRIGNQSKVEVSINGEKIDISKYSRKNISDFDWPNVN